VNPVLEPLLRRCELLASCEQLVDLAARHGELADPAVGGVDDLHVVVHATADLLALHADAYADWADRVAGMDPLLARDLRALAELLEQCRDQAAKAGAAALDLAESGDLEAA
jgi:hypothetical protein